MKKVTEYLKDYAKYHQTRGNKICHLVGVPLVVMSVLGLCDQVILLPAQLPLVHLSLAFLIWISTSIFYLVLDFRLGSSMLFTTGTLYAMGANMPVAVLWAVFVVAWIIQFVGHYRYEHRSPAFLTNLLQLLIGPLFIQNWILRIYRI